MRRILGVILVVIGIIIGISALGISFSSQTTTASEEILDYDVSKMNEIKVESTVSDITITPVEAEGLTINVHSSNDDYKVKAKEKGSTLIIELTEKKQWITFGRSMKTVDILVPKEYEDKLSVTTTVGSIVLKEPIELKELIVKTTAGDIENISGKIDYVTVASTAGDVKMKDLETVETTLQGSAGDFRLDNFVGSITGRNTAGDLIVNFKDENHNIDFKGSAGDIKINIPSPSFELDASSSVGDISIGFPITSDRSSTRKVQGTVNDGKYTVKVSTSVGDINIE
ncbi:DUF4097 family beta strand repeat-containing protein [Alkalihalobacillus sp. LMS39]|uniref:DUF4097 family beta strand repeat-containing protein n=1 Tax=Alkalihalobacillus sp. LMS39 TaxID=2924032 RepID=UPI001FB44AB7|nr:DUF4097 family beta strand repeat-containing protein [Alkalihalobacillus sp. LMS39]UOE95508.1 DUF4097 domain-containing protein [Alkalihalobacillus sp. LMS39]